MEQRATLARHLRKESVGRPLGRVGRGGNARKRASDEPFYAWRCGPVKRPVQITEQKFTAAPASQDRRVDASAASGSCIADAVRLTVRHSCGAARTLRLLRA